jgi:uncharacterized protein (DUF302 family)
MAQLDEAQLDVVVALDVPATRTALQAALQEQGFGILTEIDIQATFEAKLGAEHEPHRILGVCQPAVAKQALDLDRDVALLLPCTVTLREIDGGTEVRVLDPRQAFTLAAPATQRQLEPLAEQVRSQLALALARLAAEPGGGEGG